VNNKKTKKFYILIFKTKKEEEKELKIIYRINLYLILFTNILLHKKIEKKYIYKLVNIRERINNEKIIFNF
jgi:hypothetical protein